MAPMVLAVAALLRWAALLGVLVHPAKVQTEELVVAQAGYQLYPVVAVEVVAALEETVLVLVPLVVMGELEYKTFIKPV